MEFYTSFQAKFWLDEKRCPSAFDGLRFLFFRPLSRFLRRYALKGGFRDGWQGYVACVGDAFQTVVSYAKFLEGARPSEGKRP
jgi:hypothetical protein